MKKFFKETFRLIGALLALVRGIMIMGMIAVAAMTIYLIYVTAQMTMNQYNETLAWQNTAYDIPLAEIEPALVANTLDTDIVAAATAWENLDKYLESLEGETELDKETAQEVLDEAVKWQEIYGLESDHITRLQLYLEMDDAISETYATLDSTRLQELAVALDNLEMEEATTLGQQYMQRIRDVAEDFASAKSTMTDTVWSVGTVENGVWTIPYTYTRTDLTDVLEQIQTMRKFPELDNVAGVLSDIADVLNYNKNAREYFEFQDFMESVNGATRSDYVAVSSIYTYEQAIAFGCAVQSKHLDGYTVSMQSPVTAVYYNGEPLGNNQYVRKGTPLTAEIEEIYELISIPEEMPEPQAEEQITWGEEMETYE